MSLDFPATNAAKPTASEQSQFLLHLVKRACTESSLSTNEQIKIASLEKDCLNILASADADTIKLGAIRDSIRRFIPDLEINHHQGLISHFQKNGLYRMFYHKARIKGERDKSGLETLLILGFVGVALSVPAVALFAAASTLGLPAWGMVMANGMFASAMVYLSAISYGIVNDLYATHANLAYFLFGHQPQQHSMIETNDPIAQGIAWGVAATFGPAVIAAVAFGLVTTLTAAFAPVANIIFPIGLIAMPFIAKYVDQYAKQKEQNKIEIYSELSNSSFYLGSNLYQANAMQVLHTRKEECAAYLANGDRNLFGFTKVPLMGVGMLGTMLATSALHSYLPSFLFSTVAATLIPVAVASMAIVAIGCAGIYTYVNRNKQIDNRFKLAFDQELAPDLDELYLDEDLTRIQKFTQKQVPAASPAPIQEIKSVTRYFDVKASQKADVTVDNVEPGPSHLRTKAAVSA